MVTESYGLFADLKKLARIEKSSKVKLMTEGRVDLRIPETLYQQLQELAISRGEKKNRRSGRVELTRTILSLLDKALNGDSHSISPEQALLSNPAFKQLITEELDNRFDAILERLTTLESKYDESIGNKSGNESASIEIDLAILREELATLTEKIASMELTLAEGAISKDKTQYNDVSVKEIDDTIAINTVPSLTNEDDSNSLIALQQVADTSGLNEDDKDDTLNIKPLELTARTNVFPPELIELVSGLKAQGLTRNQIASYLLESKKYVFNPNQGANIVTKISNAEREKQPAQLNLKTGN